MQQSGVIRRTRSGCDFCKQRRIKCDETNPLCKQCIKRGLKCPGYHKIIKWSQKYEKLHSKSPLARHGSFIGNEQTTTSGQIWSPNKNADSYDCLDELVNPVPTPDFTFTCSLAMDDEIAEEVNSVPIGDQQQHVYSSEESTVPTQQQRDLDRLTTVMASTLETEKDLLSKHYFSLVCIVNSGFDSPANPFRAYVADLMSADAVIHHCILSMSAAHLYQHSETYKRVALEYRIEAMACLRTKLSDTGGRGGNLGTGSHSQLGTLLFGTLLLGMSSPWHHVSSLGRTFLHGARSLLKSSQIIGQSGSTISQFGGRDGCQLVFRDRSEATFLAGAVAFWEMLLSYHLDQDPSTVDYLERLLCQDDVGLEEEGMAPNPWTGINTGLFLLAAKVGTVVRQARMLQQQLADAVLTRGQTGPMPSDLLETASYLERRIRCYAIRPAQQMRDTGDRLTPNAHFETMARVYQLTMRLELYTVFPQLLTAEDGPPPSYPSSLRTSPFGHHPGVVGSLAINILLLLSSIPVTSGTKAIQLLPLVVAGSALQYRSILPQRNSQAADDTQCTAAREAVIPFTTRDETVDVLHHWRTFVQTALYTIYKYVGLESARCGAKIVEHVWTRSDSKKCGRGYNIERLGYGLEEFDCFVYWTDVMREEHLETLLG